MEEKQSAEEKKDDAHEEQLQEVVELRQIMAKVDAKKAEAIKAKNFKEAAVHNKHLLSLEAAIPRLKEAVLKMQEATTNSDFEAADIQNNIAVSILNMPPPERQPTKLELWHGTTEAAGKSIAKENVLRPSKKGMMGRAMYFTSSRERAAEYAKLRGDFYAQDAVVILCEVFVNSWKEWSGEPPYTTDHVQDWKQYGEGDEWHADADAPICKWITEKWDAQHCSKLVENVNETLPLIFTGDEWAVQPDVAVRVVRQEVIILDKNSSHLVNEVKLRWTRSACIVS